MDKIRNGDPGAEEGRPITTHPEPPEGTPRFDMIPVKTTASPTIREQSFLNFSTSGTFGMNNR